MSALITFLHGVGIAIGTAFIAVGGLFGAHPEPVTSTPVSEVSSTTIQNSTSSESTSGVTHNIEYKYVTQDADFMDPATDLKSSVTQAIFKKGTRISVIKSQGGLTEVHAPCGAILDCLIGWIKSDYLSDFPVPSSTNSTSGNAETTGTNLTPTEAYTQQMNALSKALEQNTAQISVLQKVRNHESISTVEYNQLTQEQQKAVDAGDVFLVLQQAVADGQALIPQSPPKLSCTSYTTLGGVTYTNCH